MVAGRSKPPTSTPTHHAPNPHANPTVSPASPNFRPFQPWQILLAVSVAVLCNSTIINNDLTYDDNGTLTTNTLVTESKSFVDYFTHDFWGTPMADNESHKSFRPFTTLTYRWTYILFGFEPFPYHVTDLVLHTVTSVVFLYVARALVQDTSLALVAGLLFAAHPIHTEAVANITGRADVLCALFFFLGFLAYREALTKPAWFAASAVCYVLSALSKESGLTLIGVTIAYELLVGTDIAKSIASIVLPSIPRSNGQTVTSVRGVFGRTILMASVAIMLLWLRVSVSGARLFPEIPFMDSPAPTAKSFWTRTFSYAYIYSVNIWLLIWPQHLRADYSMGVVPMVTSLLSPEGGVVIAFYIGLVSLLGFAAYRALYRSSYSEILACAFLIGPFIPASNLISHVGFVVAERLLYLPSSGFCVLLALALRFITDNYFKSKSSTALLTIALAITSVYMTKSYTRNADWLNNNTLWKAEMQNEKVSFKTLELYAVNEYMYGLYSYASEEQKAAINEDVLDKGLALYHRAMRAMILNGGSQDFIMHQVNWYTSHNMHKKALAVLDSTIALTIETFNNLDMSWCLHDYMYASKYHTQLNRLYRAKGMTKVYMGDMAAAVPEFQLAVDTSIMQNDLQTNHYYLSRALVELGQKKAALTELRECLRIATSEQIRNACQTWLNQL